MSHVAIPMCYQCLSIHSFRYGTHCCHLSESLNFLQLHSFDYSHPPPLLQATQCLLHVPHELPNILLNDAVWKKAKLWAHLLMRLEQHRYKHRVCHVSAPFNCFVHVLR